MDRSKLRLAGEATAWALVQVVYTLLPLVILFVLYAVLWYRDMAKLMGGPDVMFVCLVALVDATRDAIKSVMLQSEGHDRDGVDGIIVMSIILVAMNITVLIVSILRDRGSIKVEMLDWDGFQRTFLVAALLFSWFMKSRAKYFEEKGEGNRGLLTSPVEPKAD